MKNRKLFVLLIALLAFASIIFFRVNPSLERPELTRKDITSQNLAGYDLFYRNQYIDSKQSDWFDVVYEDCKIENNTLLISILIYPKYKKEIEFTLYPIISEELANYTFTGITELQINQTNILDGPELIVDGAEEILSLQYNIT